MAMPTPLKRRKTHASLDSPPVFLFAKNTNFVLEIEGGAHEDGKVIVSQKRAEDDISQQWIVEEEGFISSCVNKDLVLDHPISGQGSAVVATQRKDVAHDWTQLWEYHRGYIRSRSNHDLVLDVRDRSTESGASVIVFRPHKHSNNENQKWNIRTADGNTYIPPPVAIESPGRPFDRSQVDARLTKLWKLGRVFGKQTTPEDIYYNEIVSDRYCLINGVQLLRDEIQLAFEKGGDLKACAIDLSLPTVMTTLAHTNCGDRINHAFLGLYNNVVASRFSNLAINGELMTENFSPAGGGTDDGGVLAYVTVSHQLDDKIRKRIYDGNESSYILVNFDLMTHVGCDMNSDGKISFGYARESDFREKRSACGAIIGTIKEYNEKNIVHNRIRKNIGESNYAVLTKGMFLPNGTNITFVVAAAIVVIQGLYDTCAALTTELDERSVAHATASTTINGANKMIYFARATVFGGSFKVQGFGLDASRYSGKIVQEFGKPMLILTYDGKSGDQLDIETIKYTINPQTILS